MKYKVCVKMLNGDLQYETFDSQELANMKLAELVELVEKHKMAWVGKCLLNTNQVVSIYVSESKSVDINEFGGT